MVTAPTAITIEQLATWCRNATDDRVTQELVSWLPHLRSVIIPLSRVLDVPTGYLTEREKSRAATMRPARRLNFLGGRLALKTLALRWEPSMCHRPAHTVETVHFDSPLPQCGVELEVPPHCSLAHDDTYAAAVVMSRPAGVDVERVREKLRRLQDEYASAAEQRLAEGHVSLPLLQGLARIWTIKEAVVKATSLDLFSAFRTVEVRAIGRDVSRVLVSRDRWTARHVDMEGHILTVCRPDA